MFTLRNKVARTILFCSQRCYLTEETEKDKQRQTQERGKKDNFLQTGLSRLCVPGCPLYSLTHSHALNKHWLTWLTGMEGERGNPLSFITPLFYLCSVSSKGKGNEVWGIHSEWQIITLGLWRNNTSKILNEWGHWIFAFHKNLGDRWYTHTHTWTHIQNTWR